MKSAVLFAVSILFAVSVISAGPQVTVYNQKFGVVKESRTFDLKSGENDVIASDVAFHIEPTSVILRDINNPDSIKILEQNFEDDPLDQGKMLLKYEGKEIDVKMYSEPGKDPVIKKVKVIRSGYVPHQQAYGRYGQQYQYAQSSYVYGNSNSPIVELDGKILFSMPGQPLFDELGKGEFLKPSLLWTLFAKDGGKHETELSYITGGMNWDATYNVLFPESGDNMDIIGWVNLDNQCGKTFEDAEVKLMAGDVNRVDNNGMPAGREMLAARSYDAYGNPQTVASREFDEYHLYTINRKVTLRDREMKQVEFLRASNVKASRSYVYDGYEISSRYSRNDYYSMRQQRDYGTESNKKVFVMLMIDNSEANKLGVPLPKGKISLYRKDGNRNEFIGEDTIDHTPKDEKIKIKSGNAFDLVGSRKQTDFKVDTGKQTTDESFEITIANHKKEEATVTVVEHLYRCLNWEIVDPSDIFKKTDAATIEFKQKLKPNEEKKISYSVHYSW